MSREIEFNQDLFQFENYCKKHLAFVSLIVKETNLLEALAPALKSLSVSWVENKEGCLADAEVVLFNGLIEELKSISGTFHAASSYLNKLAEDSVNSVCFSSSNAPSNNLFLNWIILVNQDERLIQNFLAISKSLRIAVRMLRSDVLSVGIEPKGTTMGFGSRLILVAAVMVNESACAARAEANLMRSKEKQWQIRAHLARSPDTGTT